MSDSRPVKVILKGQAKEEFEKLNHIAGEQQAKEISNSEEIQLLKSIRQKVELIKENPMFGKQYSKKTNPEKFGCFKFVSSRTLRTLENALHPRREQNRNCSIHSVRDGSPCIRQVLRLP